MTLPIANQQIEGEVKVLLTLFTTLKDWTTCDLHNAVQNASGTTLEVKIQGAKRKVHVDVILLPRSYQGIEERIREIYYDKTWQCLIHFVESDTEGPALQFAKGAERMGYDQVDADDQFAPMINPLRGTRGLEGKGRKWHTSTDIDGLMRHLSDMGHSKNITARDNPGLGLPGYLYASSLKAQSKEADKTRSVTCIMNPASGVDGQQTNATSTRRNEIDEVCKWLAIQTV